MNNDLSVTGHVFKLQYGDQTGSRRNDANATAVEPRSLSISHAPYTDSSTKVPGTRTVMRLEKVVVNDTTGRKSKVVTQLTMQIPEETEVTDTVITDEIAILELLLGLSGLKSAVFVNKEQ